MTLRTIIARVAGLSIMELRRGVLRYLDIGEGFDTHFFLGSILIEISPSESKELRR